MSMALFASMGLALPVLSYLSTFINTSIPSGKTPQKKRSRATNFGLFYITFTLIASVLGDSLVSSSSEETSIGVYGLLYVLGLSLGFLLLALGFASKMKKLNVSSSIELMEVKYHSAGLKKYASLLCAITIGGLLIGQVVASKALLVSLGLSSSLYFLAFWAIVIAYFMLRKWSKAQATSNVQLIYIILIFSGIFLYCLLKEPPSLCSINSICSTLTVSFSCASLTFSGLFSAIVMPALYCIIEQDYAQPFFVARNRRTAILFALGSSAFMILFSLIPIYFGIKAHALGLAIPDGVNPLITVLSSITNEMVVFLALSGLVAGIIASFDALLQSASGMVIESFKVSFTPFGSQDYAQHLLGIIISIVVIGSSFFVTAHVLQILNYSYELYDSCLVVPLLMSYWRKDLKKGSAMGAMAFGLMSFILFNFIPLSFPKEIASIGLSFIGFCVGHYIETFYTSMANSTVQPAVKVSMQSYHHEFLFASELTPKESPH